MGRHKRAPVQQANGSFLVEVSVPRFLWKLAVTMASAWEVDPTAAFRIMLQKIEAPLLDGNTDSLGAEYAPALHRLQLECASVVNEDPKLPPIEYGLLHASVKLKSGFVGIYANGQGFRAMGKTPGHPGVATHYIGTFPTAEEAAWRRRLYYKANDLPYGAYEDAIEALRKVPAASGWPEEALHKEVIWQFGLAGNTAALEDVPKQYEAWVGRDWVMENMIAQGARRDAEKAAEKAAEEKVSLERRAASKLAAQAKLEVQAVEQAKLAAQKASDELVAAEEAKIPEELRDSKRVLRELMQERKQARTRQTPEAIKAKAEALKTVLTPTGEVVNGIALLPMPIDPSTWVDTHDDPVVDDELEPVPTKPDPWSAMRSYRPAT